MWICMYKYVNVCQCLCCGVVCAVCEGTSECLVSSFELRSA